MSDDSLGGRGYVLAHTLQRWCLCAVDGTTEARAWRLCREYEVGSVYGSVEPISGSGDTSHRAYAMAMIAVTTRRIEGVAVPEWVCVATALPGHRPADPTDHAIFEGAIGLHAAIAAHARATYPTQAEPVSSVAITIHLDPADTL